MRLRGCAGWSAPFLFSFHEARFSRTNRCPIFEPPHYNECVKPNFKPAVGKKCIISLNLYLRSLTVRVLVGLCSCIAPEPILFSPIRKYQNRMSLIMFYSFIDREMPVGPTLLRGNCVHTYFIKLHYIRCQLTHVAALKAPRRNTPENTVC